MSDNWKPGTGAGICGSCVDARRLIEDMLLAPIGEETTAEHDRAAIARGAARAWVRKRRQIEGLLTFPEGTDVHSDAFATLVSRLSGEYIANARKINGSDSAEPDLSIPQESTERGEG